MNKFKGHEYAFKALHIFTSCGINFYLFIQLQPDTHLEVSEIGESSNLWETLVVSPIQTRYKHAPDGCMLPVIPMQSCQADERKCCIKQLWSVTAVEVNL